MPLFGRLRSELIDMIYEAAVDFVNMRWGFLLDDYLMNDVYYWELWAPYWQHSRMALRGFPAAIPAM